MALTLQPLTPDPPTLFAALVRATREDVTAARSGDGRAAAQPTTTGSSA